MRIMSFEIFNRREDYQAEVERAEVVFYAVDLQARFQASAPLSATTADLVKDALRQLRRMPEYRTGVKDIVFAQHVINLIPDLAATP